MVEKTYIDLSSFGIQPVKAQAEEQSMDYCLETGDGSICMSVYEILPGIELYDNAYNTRQHFCGEMETPHYYQLCYCHAGVYESRITPHRLLRLMKGELMVFSDILRNVDACMPLGYYRGFNLIFFPDFFSDRTKTVLEEFGIDVPGLFEGLIEGRLFHHLSCGSVVARIAEELYLGGRDRDQIRMKLCMLKLLLALSDPKNFKPGRYTYRMTEKMQTMEAVRAYIEENLERHMTIRQLAERFGMSETSLKENFRRMYGNSPYEYLKYCRMHRAAELLRESALSVASIGMQVGYENPSKFAAAFAGIFHRSPMAYRKNG